MEPHTIEWVVEQHQNIVGQIQGEIMTLRPGSFSAEGERVRVANCTAGILFEMHGQTRLVRTLDFLS